MKNSTLKSGGGLPKITKTQAEILRFLTEYFYTPKQIALRRKTSLQSVYEIIEILKNKGLLNRQYKTPEKKEGSIQDFRISDTIRIHGEQWTCKLLFKDERYSKRIGEELYLDGNYVKLCRDVIIISSNQYFYGVDSYAATAKSLEYWNRFFLKIENEYKVIICKDGASNKERTKKHYSLIRNGLAIECEKQGERVKVRDVADGKVWFTIDNSLNLHEAETTHPQNAQVDMQRVVEPLFNDMKDKKFYLPSELTALLQQSIHIQAEMQREVAVLMESQKITLNQLSTIIQLITPVKQEDRKEEASRPEYIG
jgi:DNA-binding CsgD family transcriptional regulator